MNAKFVLWVSSLNLFFRILYPLCFLLSGFFIYHYNVGIPHHYRSIDLDVENYYMAVYFMGFGYRFTLICMVFSIAHFLAFAYDDELLESDKSGG
jgi:hypothetical protein